MDAMTKYDINHQHIFYSIISNLASHLSKNHYADPSNLGLSSDSPHKFSYWYTYSNKTHIRDKVKEKCLNTTKVYNEIYT